MTLDQVVTIVSSVVANGVILIAFRVNLEHRLTKLETHIEYLLKGDEVAR